MDNGHGRFVVDEELTSLLLRVPKAADRPVKRSGLFYIGERIRLRDGSFRIKNITPIQMLLRYLPHPKLPGRSLKRLGKFRHGEELELRGSRFRVESVMRRTLVLRLLPRDPEGTDDE